MDRAEVTNLVRKMEKDLYRINSQLKSLHSLEPAIAEIYTSLLKLESNVRDDSKIESFFSQLMRERKILSLLKEMSLGLSKLKAAIDEKEDIDARSNIFIESYRNYRLYTFPNPAATIEFINQLSEIYSFEYFYFKPQFIGTIDLDSIAKELRLAKEASGLKVQVSDMEKMFNYLLLNKINQNIVFDFTGIKLTLRGPKALHAESTNARIKRLDRLCKELNGSYLLL